LRQDPRDVETVFRKNVRSCGVDAIVSPIKGYSFECCRDWTRPIDLLFIDANHEYRAVLRDFNNWVPFVKRGGVVALHDVGEVYDGPKRVVAEMMRYPSFGPMEQVERLAWAVKHQSN
jgi:MMP 1-O-methyltransferase